MTHNPGLLSEKVWISFFCGDYIVLKWCFMACFSALVDLAAGPTVPPTGQENHEMWFEMRIYLFIYKEKALKCTKSSRLDFLRQEIKIKTSHTYQWKNPCLVELLNSYFTSMQSFPANHIYETNQMQIPMLCAKTNCQCLSGWSNSRHMIAWRKEKIKQLSFQSTDLVVPSKAHYTVPRCFLTFFKRLAHFILSVLLIVLESFAGIKPAARSAGEHRL